ncbi:hypothetical protein Noc_0547 [Nitrosococcus oceani ATCC 19707]|uniref:DUF3780 domain-containing protein n=3 Tax=Nitrosococcus oceani TaxID=1229 RepID=Q3JDM9_NITOC|nr:anti-phage-associated DUF3780 domain-containing protein [Nitrosococcus oceani]KFI20475.1 hypothetical protein IB75_02870 [Nitrosococcus oceani C-27]ABA57067.1 hypothetical protein Noc_0547 [Nitrosococcus oceani ATCC 19707]EDZ65946.1 hypothetical protein NOC27_2626 [Nitrosococcus oceani AFC27]KFI23585.1 hypothetical protein HW44_02960 [Nitrosococcus oceani]GEM19919.1 hypothetical protein NONS58_13190 [Nitrosococcus oceani]
MKTTAQKIPPMSRQSPRRYAHRTLGFGVPTTLDPHHYQVTIPRGTKQPVLIRECLGIQAGREDSAVLDRVCLERRRWTAIANEVKRAFNHRLRRQKLAPGRWKMGENPVDRLLGKELCVLAWAIEEASPEQTGLAVRNWLALRPEERWWLFGMTAIATGGLQDSRRGWRRALRYALADLPQATLLPTGTPKAADKNTKTPDLFD